MVKTLPIQTSSRFSTNLAPTKNLNIIGYVWGRDTVTSLNTIFVFTNQIEVRNRPINITAKRNYPWGFSSTKKVVQLLHHGGSILWSYLP